MKNIAKKLVKLEEMISFKKGPFSLFVLFLQKDSAGLWDLLVSAPWITKEKEKSLKYIVNETKKYLKPDEMLKLSRIVIIEQNNPALRALQQAVNVEHGVVEVKDSNFFGLQIKHAYFITSQRQGKFANKKAQEEISTSL